MKIKIKLSKKSNINYYKKELIELDIEEYLKGVVPAEIGNAPIEACKAQAVAARTFAISRTSNGRAITDTTNDQAFLVSRLNSNAYNNAHDAVDATKGQVLYSNGKLCSTCVYSDCNGGRTYSSEEVWGGVRSYLVAKKDPWDAASGRSKKNGHGVGMSQVGAIYAASIGKTYQEILSFYYDGTTIMNNYGEKNVAPAKPEASAPVINIVEKKEDKKSMGLTNNDFVDFLKKMVGQKYWYSVIQ